MGNLFAELMSRRIYRAAIMSIVCSVSWIIPSGVQARTASEDCNEAAPEPVAYVNVPGFPFSAIPSRDGCWVFVSLTPSAADEKAGIAVLRRVGGGASLVRVVPVRTILREWC